jgi:hypothetical protein
MCVKIGLTPTGAGQILWEIQVMRRILRPEVRKLRTLHSEGLHNSCCGLNVSLVWERLRNVTNALKTEVRQFEIKEKLERKAQMRE